MPTQREVVSVLVQRRKKDNQNPSMTIIMMSRIVPYLGLSAKIFGHCHRQSTFSNLRFKSSLAALARAFIGD
jgi:hypothetical protein